MAQRGRIPAQTSILMTFLTSSIKKTKHTDRSTKYAYTYMRIRPVLHLFKFSTAYSLLEKNNRYYLISMFYAKHHIKHLYALLDLHNILMK